MDEGERAGQAARYFSAYLAGGLYMRLADVASKGYEGSSSSPRPRRWSVRERDGWQRRPRRLSVERYIAAPPDTVWKIMTERLAEWWLPETVADRDRRDRVARRRSVDVTDTVRLARSRRITGSSSRFLPVGAWSSRTR
ncbi:MAG: hypothetical protein R3E53_00485 [Myxococcota bacterium]